MTPEASLQAPIAAAPSDCRQTSSATLALAVVRWGVPPALAALSIFLMMWMLHIGTWYYVVEMTRLEMNNATLPRGGALLDPVARAIGKHKLHIKSLDNVAAGLPTIWALGSLATKELRLWTKVFFCNSVLALGKGVLGFITIVPDSAGWERCKARIGPDNLDFFVHEVPNPAESGHAATLWTILGMEVFGPRYDRVGSGVRFCADMLYSGHTFFTTLYALGLVELTTLVVAARNWGRWSFKSILAVGGITALMVAYQSMEIVAVLWHRFHYSMDVAMAVLITLLWYTNGPLNAAASRWDNLTSWVPVDQEKGHVLLSPDSAGESVHAEGNACMPAHSAPGCCSSWYHHVDTHAKEDDVP